ncbi:MAG: hypothetical protein KatS3mg043_0788 [Rhodothermaceae bacterium]|nr:MAG: hypothetical protein KatS3mg043_0788 [Rhodothermaceae bacterium]
MSSQATSDRQPRPGLDGEKLSRLIQQENDPRLAGAKEALKQKLLQAVMQQALAELEEPEQIAEALAARLDGQHPLLRQAGEALQARLLRQVATRAVETLADPARAATAARKHVGEEHESLQGAVRALQEQLLATVADRATEALRDAGATAGRARALLASDHPVLQAAVEALTNRLDEEVAGRAVVQFEDVETAVERAHRHVPEEHPVLERAAGALNERLYEEVARRSIAALHAAETTARAARAHVPDDHEALREAVETLHGLLVTEVAGRATDTLADTEAAARAARAHVPDDHEALTGAVRRLHDLLVGEVARRATDTLASTEEAAREARQHIPDDLPELTGAGRELRALLLADIARQTREALQDAEAAAREAMSRFEDREAVLSEARRVLKERMLQRMLSDAVREITEAVMHDAEAHEAPFREATAAVRHTVTRQEEAPAPSGDPAGAEPGDRHEGPDTGDERPVFEEIRFDGLVSPAEGASPEAGAPDSLIREVAPGEFDEEEEEPLVLAGTGDGVPGQPASPGAVCCYVYGVMPVREAPAAGPLDVEGLVPGEAVMQRVHRDLAVFFSRVPAETFGPEALRENMQEAAWVQVQVRAHTRVMERLCETGTLVPLPFGTVVRDEQAVLGLVEARYDGLRKAAGRLRGRQEWSLRIYRIDDVLLERIIEGEQKVEESLGVLSKGIARFVREEMNRMEYVEVDQMIAVLSEHCVRRAHEALLQHAEGGVFKPLVDAAEGGKGTLVANAAYLVPVEDEEAFHARVADLGGECIGLGFRFELSGPWPPYHFVEVG